MRVRFRGRNGRGISVVAQLAALMPHHQLQITKAIKDTEVVRVSLIPQAPPTCCYVQDEDSIY